MLVQFTDDWCRLDGPGLPGVRLERGVTSHALHQLDAAVTAMARLQG